MSPDVADAARSILRQYNESDYRDYKFHGPHYITWGPQGGFIMRPYGLGAKWRYRFQVAPDYMFGELKEPLWTFMVMC